MSFFGGQCGKVPIMQDTMKTIKSLTLDSLSPANAEIQILTRKAAFNSFKIARNNVMGFHFGFYSHFLSLITVKIQWFKVKQQILASLFFFSVFHVLSQNPFPS